MEYDEIQIVGTRPALYKNYSPIGRDIFTQSEQKWRYCEALDTTNDYHGPQKISYHQPVNSIAKIDLHKNLLPIMFVQEKSE